MNWFKRHLNWTWIIAVAVLLSVIVSCGAPTIVADNQPSVGTKNIYQSDNVTIYGIDGIVEYNKSFTFDFSNPNQRYVTMDIPTELESEYGTSVGCSGGNGDPLLLTNNPNAKDVTWEEIIEFIRIDNTDSIPYVIGSFTCGDYARTVHDNAERQGIRAGVAPVILIDDKGHYINHVWNVFRILDEGLMYIDCTNVSNYIDDSGWYGDTAIVFDNKGGTYHKVALFRDGNPTDKLEVKYNDFKVVATSINW